MKRRTFVTALIALPAVGLLAACGSSDGDQNDGGQSDGDQILPQPAPVADSPTPTVTDPGAATPEVLLSYTEPGGFTTAEFAFQNPPLVLITGDGMLITGAATPAMFPGPLVPQHTTRTISDAGTQAVFTAAEQAGLFADVEYVTNELVADASTSTLMFEADGVRYVHEAPALGMGGPGSTESTPESQALLDFLTDLTQGIEELAGADTLGVPVVYQPVAYQFEARPIDGLALSDPDSTIEAWPVGTGIELADAGDCVEVTRATIGDLLEEANQLTVFSENDVTYQVTVRPAYPGRSC